MESRSSVASMEFLATQKINIHPQLQFGSAGLHPDGVPLGV
jgi:hypothetical protein